METFDSDYRNYEQRRPAPYVNIVLHIITATLLDTSSKWWFSREHVSILNQFWFCNIEIVVDKWADTCESVYSTLCACVRNVLIIYIPYTYVIRKYSPWPFRVDYAVGNRREELCEHNHWQPLFISFNEVIIPDLHRFSFLSQWQKISVVGLWETVTRMR